MLIYLCFNHNKFEKHKQIFHSKLKKYSKKEKKLAIALLHTVDN